MKTLRILNRSQVAAVFGFHRSRIGDWVIKGCPILRRGRHSREAQFDFAAILAWRITDLREQGEEEEYITPDVRAVRTRLKQMKNVSRQ